MADIDISDLLTVAQAIAVIDAVPVQPRIERVALMEAQGRRLAEDIAVDRDAPAFDKSQMDGFAVRCADVVRVPMDLQIVGEIAAGSAADWPLEPGQAMAIMTGAPMPAGADGVVPVEETRREGDRVHIHKIPTPRKYIAVRGSDAKAGQIVLKRGMVMQAAQIAAAASVGAAEIAVFAKPRAAVLSTGNELVRIDETPGAHQIRNSNNAMLAALLKGMGCEVTDLGTAVDDPASIRTAIEEGLRFDLLFVTGGMSMGTYDFVPRIISDLKVGIKIAKLRIKPGKPFVFGVSHGEDVARASRPCSSTMNTGETPVPPADTFIFGLPGNPVSGFVCARRFASRLITRLGGGVVRERWLSGKLDVGLPANGPREFYQPAIWMSAGGEKSAQSEFATITPLAWKGSADLYTLATANALLVRGENEPPLAKGILVRVLEI